MSGRRGLKIQNFPSIPPLPRFFLRIYQNPLLSFASPLSFAEISVLFSRSGISVDRNQISSSREAADLGMESGDFTGIHRTGSKCHSKSKKQSSCTLPLKKKKNTYVTFEGQQSSNKKPDYDPKDHTQWQSSDTEEFDSEPEDYSDLQSSDTEEFDSEPEDYSDLFQRSNNKAELDYDTKDSAIAKMVQDSLHSALGCGLALSSKLEQTRSKNVRNGGSGTTYIRDDSDRCSTFINRGNANIVNNYSYLTTINQVGHNFIQNGGSRDSRQFQAVKVSGGTVTQGNVEEDMEDG